MDFSFANIAILLFCFIILITIVSIVKSKPSSEKKNYSGKKYFLTIKEKDFFDRIQSMLPEYQIFSQVRLADILFVDNNIDNSEYYKHFNKISSKSVDFLICKKDRKNGFEIICAIELDDPSHKQQKRIERDHFVNNAFKQASIELLRVPFKKSIEEINYQELISSIKQVKINSSYDS